ncbi:MAG: ketol-acid reductoisomerase [Eubacteriaceae bacterium]|jgi:ketol-acid reductoisomerase|nr:ketol-acid reductoisomerase [Eubacteriaceae bacterium]
MINKYYDKDCNMDALKGKTVAVIGFGSQGHAHARNLHESGVDVVVGLRPDSKSAQSARDAGLEVYDVETAAEKGDIVMMLVPDELAADIYNTQVAQHMKAGDMLMFAHGFNIHYGYVKPAADIDVSMVAPKGPGHTVRSQYVDGGGVPSLIAIYQDVTGTAKEKSLAYASGIGAGRAGILETTYKEETETDLFGEQAVLCGGVTGLMIAGFETLVDAGYQPEMAYFETMHELKLIVDLMNSGGMELMRKSVSNTAEYGDYYASGLVIGDESKAAMKKILDRIQDGSFADEFMTAMKSEEGRAKFLAEREARSHHQSSEVGAELRSMMSWLRQYD